MFGTDLYFPPWASISHILDLIRSSALDDESKAMILGNADGCSAGLNSKGGSSVSASRCTADLENWNDHPELEVVRACRPTALTRKIHGAPRDLSASLSI